MKTVIPPGEHDYAIAEGALASASLPAFDWQAEPVGERCLLVRVGRTVGVDTSRIVHAVAALLHEGLGAAVLDVVPAFTTVAVHFQPAAFPRRAGPASVQVARKVERLLGKGVRATAGSGRVVEVPACYGGDHGPDLVEVARRCKLTPQEVIALHSSRPLTVYAFFFSPGNPFAGPLDARLDIPRRSTPRTLVPAGSVGVAGGITSIYQNASPGGWNIIARTPLNLFDLKAMPPTRMQPGDLIHFRPVSPEQFGQLLEARP
ncbi:5-oxoprolinase subunit PxpB [Herbaspirillum chlorophenolicum]|uniref:5-oxoprolinase subunit PxpB n=1 Tax=Herbaspirillum chlorophenolicum TaxID=211589 RepID=UPI000AADD055|nr:5-oxoprolinase subunit PxpB [Herbaspirillum chlorophenolicum]